MASTASLTPMGERGSTNALPDGKERIGVVSHGDPWSEATWSGTVKNIAEALGRQGFSIVGVNPRSTLYERLWFLVRYQAGLLRCRPSLARLAAQIRLLRGADRSDFLRTRSSRMRQAERLRSKARSASVHRVLHMSNMSLPLDDDDLEHYLVCDSTWHSLIINLDTRHRFPARYSSYFEELERLCFARVSHFFPLARYVADDLEGHYGIDPARITVVGSGRGHMEPYFGEKDYHAQRVLFAARVRFEEKGGSLLVDAFRLALQRIPDLHLTLVGASGQEHLLAKTRNLTVLPHVSAQELEQLFREATLFAMPAPAEPWGLVYLEALASKTPILGVRRNALPELAGDGRFGFIADEPEPEAIAEALVSAFSDPQRLRRMGEDGQRHCLATYSWDRVAERIGAVLREHPGEMVVDR